LISFVVPAYNEEKYLTATLVAIHAAGKAGGERYEIVVANDDSSDATPALAKDAGARVVDVHKRQIAGTRNAGARAAQGDILFFVDADTHVNAALVNEALAAIRGGAVGGGARVRFHGDVPAWVTKFMVIFTPIYFGIGRWAAGAFVFCTREAFEAAGGFDEATYAGEEIAFSQALKRQGRFVIVKGFVETSARKAHGRSMWEMLAITARVTARAALAGGRLKRREDASFWYDGRR